MLGMILHSYVQHGRPNWARVTASTLFEGFTGLIRASEIMLRGCIFQMGKKWLA